MTHHAYTIALGVAVFFALVSSVDGATLYVANNGLNDPDCGSKTHPCRSISHAVNTLANDGDTIVVGPGRYGDLNDNGVLDDSAGEESGGFGCLVLVARSVTIMSSDGAAATMIDGSQLLLDCNVGIAVDGTKFGKPGKGFRVTNTRLEPNFKEKFAVLIAATNVTVAGNQVIPLTEPTIGSIGIGTLDGPQTALIEGNQVMGWTNGIVTRGANKTVRRNQLSGNCSAAITLSSGSMAVGNVAVGNGRSVGCAGSGAAIAMNGASTAIGNGSYGNHTGYFVYPDFNGSLSGNDVFGNLTCGLENYGAAGVLATENYWGAATGPGPDPADDVCNKNGGTTTVAPFAIKPFKVKAKIKP